jgi:hypothetical protein
MLLCVGADIAIDAGTANGGVGRLSMAGRAAGRTQPPSMRHESLYCAFPFVDTRCPCYLDAMIIMQPSSPPVPEMRNLTGWDAVP